MSRENAPVEYEQFMLFGDSITEYATDQFAGYSLLSALQLGMDSMIRLKSRVILTCGFSSDYIRRYDVLMRGYAGYTSEQGLWAFERFFPSIKKAKVNLMVSLFGFPPYS